MAKKVTIAEKGNNNKHKQIYSHNSHLSGGAVKISLNAEM